MLDGASMKGGAVDGSAWSGHRGLPGTDLESALVGVYSARCRGGDGSGMGRILPADRTRFYGYGRQALTEALRLAGVKEGDEVLLPGFLCGEVLASLAVLGTVPRFYSVDERLRADVASWDREVFGSIRAVVMVNYFGFPQFLGPVQAWCRAHGATLIEDNAHGFLSEDGEVPLGRRGDLGVFSLRKTLALPNGAALVDNRVNNKMDPDGFSYGGSCRLAEWRYRSKVVLKRLIEWGGLKSALVILACIRMARLAATGHAIPVSSSRREITMLQEACSSLTPQLLRRCDYVAECQRRRTLYQLCLDLFDGAPDVRPLFDHLPDGVVPQGFPFLYAGKDRRSLIKTWGQRGVPILSWPDHLPAAIHLHAPDHYGRVMFVPFLW
ncbi:MAG: hypothetical protein FJ245_14980 [Nitrospira sp.]|nr:hypothetical protein [Nitrospira sp.]